MSAYSTAILATSGLIAYYRLDETSGTIAHDATTNGYNATLAGVSAYSQTGAIVGDSDTSMTFTGSGTLTLPYTLNDTTFTSLSIEFWTNESGGWWHLVVTCDDTTTLVYLNGVLYTPGTTASITIGQLFDYAGSYVASNLDEVAIYKNVVLTPIQIQSHYAIAGYGVPAVMVTAQFRNGVVMEVSR